jgi:hypothetical protein
MAYLQFMDRHRRPHLVASTVLWVGGFALAGWILAWLDRFSFLSVDWHDPGGWLGRVDTETALAALARLVGMAIVAWVALTTVVYLAARLLGTDAARISWLSIGPIRRVIDATLAGSLVITTLSPLTAAAELPFEEPRSATTTETTAGSPVGPLYVPIPAGPVPTSDKETPAEAPDDDESGRGATVYDHETSVVVVSGDNLWKLAEERVEAVLGRAPTDADTAPYWVRVVEANRQRIRSGDPNLIFPGEEIVMPAVTPET